MIKKEYLANNFHLLRLLAAIGVIVSHSYTLTGLPEKDWMWRITGKNFSFSYIALSAFFIISGYLITQSAHPDKRMTAKRALIFLWKRFLRIFPAIILAVLLSVFVLGPWLTSYTSEEYWADSATWQYLKTMTLYLVQFDLPGVFKENPYPNAVNGSIWTLSYEFTLYLGVLLLALFGLLRFRFLMLFLYLIAFWKIATLPPTTPSLPLPWVNMDLYIFARFALYFMGGTILFLFKDKIPRKLWLFVPVLAAIAIGWYQGYARPATYLFLPYVIIYLAYIPGRINRFAKYGDYSYGMYLYAFPIQQTLAHFYGKLPVHYMIPLSVAITFLLAFVSWKLVEQRALKLKPAPSE